MIRYLIYAKVRSDGGERWFAYRRFRGRTFLSRLFSFFPTWTPIGSSTFIAGYEGFVGNSREKALNACKEDAEKIHHEERLADAARIVGTTKPEILEL